MTAAGSNSGKIMGYAKSWLQAKIFFAKSHLKSTAAELFLTWQSWKTNYTVGTAYGKQTVWNTLVDKYPRCFRDQHLERFQLSVGFFTIVQSRMANGCRPWIRNCEKIIEYVNRCTKCFTVCYQKPFPIPIFHYLWAGAFNCGRGYAFIGFAEFNCFSWRSQQCSYNVQISAGCLRKVLSLSIWFKLSTVAAVWPASLRNWVISLTWSLWYPR